MGAAMMRYGSDLYLTPLPRSVAELPLVSQTSEGRCRKITGNVGKVADRCAARGCRAERGPSGSE
jgi:hypothetical protein